MPPTYCGGDFEYVDGAVTKVIDPMGRETNYERDQGGRVINVQPPQDGQVTRYRGFMFDSHGNLLEQFDNTNDPAIYNRDANHRTMRYTRDSRGRVISQIDGNDHQTVFAFNGFGELSSLTDASGNVTAYLYDANGQLIAEVQEDAGPNATDLSRNYIYDGAGNLRRYTDRNGRVTEFDYDIAGRLTIERWKSGSSTVRTFT